MKKTWIRTVAALTGTGLAAVLLVAPSAFAAKGGTGSLGYEVDNGASWTLATHPASISAPLVGNSYGDAGIVADIGPASAFNGITLTGSASVTDNIWIGDGTQAYTAGTHPFASDPVNFTYGFDNHNGTFYITDYKGTGTNYAGQNLTIAQIQTDFAGSEAFAWVGVVYGGTNVSGFVTSVNGRSTGHRVMSVTDQSGTLSATVS
jgi:hypothetical protein